MKPILPQHEPNCHQFDGLIDLELMKRRCYLLVACGGGTGVAGSPAQTLSVDLGPHTHQQNPAEGEAVSSRKHRFLARFSTEILRCKVPLDPVAHCGDNRAGPGAPHEVP